MSLSNISTDIAKQLKYVDQRTRDIVNGYSRNIESVLISEHEDDRYYSICSNIITIILIYIYDHFMFDHGTYEWNINGNEIKKLFKENKSCLSIKCEIVKINWNIKLFQSEDKKGLILSLSSIYPDKWKYVEIVQTVKCRELDLIHCERTVFASNLIKIEPVDSNHNELTIIIDIRILKICCVGNRVYFRCKDYYKIQRKIKNDNDDKDEFIKCISYEYIMDTKMDEYDRKFNEMEKRLNILTSTEKDESDKYEYKEEDEKKWLLEEDKLHSFLVDDAKLAQYYDILVMNGFDDILFLYDITRDDLKEIGITKIGHQNRMIHCIEMRKKRESVIKKDKDKTYLFLILFIIGYIIPINLYIVSLIIKQIYLCITALILLLIITLFIVNKVDDRCTLPWSASPFGENKDKSINFIYLHLIFTIMVTVCCIVYFKDKNNYTALTLALLSYAAGLLCGVVALYDKKNNNK